MPDYNLTGLSTRSFEHLIQAIALKEIGPNTIIYGDGPDGGREATFEGIIPYPNTLDAWNGYGVIQAKFKQRELEPQPDGDWAIEQLETELQKFIMSKRRLRKPDYYIFATNVVLTPVHETGSKDKLDNLIKKYQDQLPLKGYDVWDYDKICRFLDDNEDIRRSYWAWITPGDVLAEMMKWLTQQSPNFDKIMINFLQKELRADLYANLEQAGHQTNQDKVSLASVFVDLPINQNSTNNTPLKFVAHMLAKACDKLAPESSHVTPAHRPKSALTPGRFVLIGGPGQGKTTVGQFICQLHRAAIVKRRPSLLPEIRRTIDELETQCQQEGMMLPDVLRFPIRIELSKFASELASKSVNSLLAYIVALINRRTDQTITPTDLRNWLEAYPWLLILDGLDEVPASSNRDAVLAAINDFRIDAHECQADILVIATTRPQGYNKDFSPGIYEHLQLLPLSPEQALHYGRRLAQIRYGNDPDRQNKVVSRLEIAARNTQTTAYLMGSPLQVTIMTTLVDRIGQPPQERWRLFDKYYEVIYQRETEKDTNAAKILRTYETHINAIHYQVGLLLQVESERSGQTDARISIDRLTTLIQTHLTSEGYEPTQLKQQIITAATERLVFLVSMEDNKIGFEIRSLQEFMAAEGLMDGSDEIVGKRLTEIAPIEHWRNVFLFAAGKCFADRQHLRDTIYSICGQLNDNIDDQMAYTTLAGSQLASDLLGDISEQPKYKSMLARIALRLLDLPVNDYHTKLVKVMMSEEKLEAMYGEELERRLQQRNSIEHLGTWVCFMMSVNKREYRTVCFTDLWFKYRQFITKEEYAVILKAFEPYYNEVSSWLTNNDNFLNDLPQYLSPDDLDGGNYFGASDSTSWEGIILRGYNHTRDGFLEISFKADLDISWHFDITSVTEKWEWLTSLQQLHHYHPSWLPLVAGARFIQIPTHVSLAHELRIIAQTGVYPFDSTPLNVVPWPMGAILRSISALSNLHEIADRVEAGAFGTFEDWAKAEKRWQEHGITNEDINYMTDDHWPFDNQISHIGFPFVTLYSISYPSPLFFDYFFTLHKKVKGSKLGQRIARWILFAATITFRFHGSTPFFIDTKVFREIIEDISLNRGLEINMLEVIKKDILSEEYIELMDTLGRERDFYLEYLDENLIKELITVFRQQPQRLGILRILALTIMFGNQIPIDHLHVIPEQHSDPKIKEAAIIIKLAQDNLQTDEEAIRLVNLVIELMTNCPDIISSILDTINKNNALNNPILDKFLLELYRQVPAEQWKEKQEIIDLLNGSLKRRTSRLAEPHVWLELQLPQGLDKLIRSQGMR